MVPPIPSQGIVPPSMQAKDLEMPKSQEEHEAIAILGGGRVQRIVDGVNMLLVQK